MPSNSISETGVVFFSAGGHSHNGLDSSLIDTRSYSIFDFNFGRLYTTRTREKEQQKNETSLRNYIINVVNSAVLDPAGIVLQDNIINSNNIIAGSITGNLIAANTITADNIVAGTLVTERLILSNGDFWESDGSFRLGGANGINYSGSGSISIGSGVTIIGNIVATGSISGVTISAGIISGGQITGNISSTGTISGGAIVTDAGFVGGWQIFPGSLSGGGTVLYSNGVIQANRFRTALSNARIEMGPGITTADEIEFYDTNNVRCTIRNPGGGEFRISAAGGTYTFGTTLNTARSIVSTAAISGQFVAASTQFLGPSGNNSTPTYAFDGLDVTGIRKGAAGQIILVSNGVTAASISSSSVSFTGSLTVGSFSVSGVLSAGGFSTAGTYNGVFLNQTPEGHSRVETTLGGSMLKVLNSGDGVQARDGFDLIFTNMRAAGFFVGSSITLKENIKDLDNVLETLNSVKVYSWSYTDDPKKDIHVFPVAEDLPEYLLSKESTGELVVDLRDTIGYLWKGIQELNDKFDEKIKNIETKLEEM